MEPTHDRHPTTCSAPGRAARSGTPRRRRAIRCYHRKLRAFHPRVFYRGLHCPICRTQLSDLETKLPDFGKRGVGVVAISSDNAERVERSQREWKLPNLRLGYCLDLRVARAWGLYLSTGHVTTSAGVDEPDMFSVPAQF